MLLTYIFQNTENENILTKLDSPIPSFGFKDNSVHLLERSPFWVGIFIILTKKTTMFKVLCRNVHSDWQSIEAFLYVIGKCSIM